MGSSFQRRRLRFTFQMASGTFNKKGNPDTVELVDYRSMVEISSNGGYDFSTCRASIYGINKDVMDRLTVIAYQNIGFMKNVVTIEATDNDGAFSTVFRGEIYAASPNYDSAPDVPLEIEARAGVIGSLAASFASSFPGPRKVSEIMGVIAKELGVTLENNGVESYLVDQTLSGTSLEKVNKIKDAANIQYWYDQAAGVLAIAPIGKPRESKAIEISSETGMVGWPSKKWYGMEFRSLFNPSIHQGCKINMKSEVPSCNGEWYISKLAHSLSCNMPGGPWFSHFVAAPINMFIAPKR